MTADADLVMRLGRNMADALDTSDVVGRWMSHHLADLICQCEAEPENRELAESTSDLILKLWKHKEGAQFEHAPLERVQPVLAAIARLQPNQPQWAHFRTFSPEERPGAEDMSYYPVLRAACAIDREFGNLVRFAVALAAEEALNSEEPWVLAGLALGGTEVDDALKLLQQQVEAYRQLVAEYSPDSISEDEPFELGAIEHAMDEPEPGGRVGSTDSTPTGTVLHTSLRKAIGRCTRLLLELDRLSARRDTSWE